MYSIKDDGTYYVVYYNGKKFCKHRKDINKIEVLKKYYGINSKGVSN